MVKKDCRKHCGHWWKEHTTGSLKAMECFHSTCHPFSVILWIWHTVFTQNFYIVFFEWKLFVQVYSNLNESPPSLMRVHLSKMYRLWHKQSSPCEDCIAASELVHQKPRLIEYVNWVWATLYCQLPGQQWELSQDTLNTMVTTTTQTLLAWPVNKETYATTFQTAEMTN